MDKSKNIKEDGGKHPKNEPRPHHSHLPPSFDDSSGHCKKMPPSDSDIDLLLADAGYNVKKTDLPIVVQRLEQLESLFASHDANHLSSEAAKAILYNPSDMAGCIGGLLEELGGGFALSDFNFLADSQYAMDMDPFGTSDSFKFTDSLENSMPLSSSKDSMLFDGVGLQDYKILEDQNSSNQIGIFFENDYDRRMRDMHPYGITPVKPSSIGISAVPNNIQSPQQQPQLKQVGERSPVPPSPQPLKKAKHSHSADLADVVVVPTPTPSPSASASSHSRDGSSLWDQNQAQAQAKTVGKPTLSPSSTSASSPVVVPFNTLNAKPELAKKKKLSTNQVQTTPARGEFPITCNTTVATPTSQVPQAAPAVAFAQDDSGEQADSAILLVQLLMACAEVHQKNDFVEAEHMLREIERLVSSNCNGAMGRVARHFAQALRVRTHRLHIEDWPCPYQPNPRLAQCFYESFYDSSPYLKFSHFMANQAILAAFEGKKVVHVIDFNIMDGAQWPPLLHALAMRHEGPPKLRMTGIGPPIPEEKDYLQDVGNKLAYMAKIFQVDFSFRGVVATKLDDVKQWMFEIQEGEAIAVNSIFQLHRLLYSQNAIDSFLRSIRDLNPNVVTVVEQEANHNTPAFLERYVESLYYYSSMFDSLEASPMAPSVDEMIKMENAEMHLGREIMNIVACEGAARVERHEPMTEWRQRMIKAGFHPSHLGSNAFNQASMLVHNSAVEGYTVDENMGILTLGWHSRPLIAASAWQCT